MFTGLIESTAEVTNRTENQIAVTRPAIFDDVKTGSSIAVSGVCLSIVKLTDTEMTFDVHEETWSRTKLGSLNKGDRVNLERALKADGRFEGHIVQGHVDAVGECSNAAMQQCSNTVLKIMFPQELKGLIVEKGSIAIDGVSLTVCEVRDTEFAVVLIPHTLEGTTLGALAEGDDVNLEADILGKYGIL